ncbi:MAG TPA: alpha-galactosidase [Armatimonadota bacterium]|jgi:hypothetical protein
MMNSPSHTLTLQELFPAVANSFLAGIHDAPLCAVVAEGIGPEDFRRGLTLVSQREDFVDGGRRIDMRWEDAERGLTLELVYAVFADTGVLEVSGRLSNNGPRVLRGFRGGFPLYLTADLAGMGIPRLTTVHSGAAVDGCYPPPAYQLSHRDLVDLGACTLTGGHAGGRSTEDGEMPYAIITDPVSGQGMFAVLEWPCRWVMSAAVKATAATSRSLELYAHPAWLLIDLQPGESVVIPKACLGFFTGDDLAGSNALRRHIVRHVLRSVNGQPLLPPVFYNHFYGLRDWDVHTLEREADAYADIGVEYFVVDAGWFEGDFRKGIGNWEVVDQRRFPEGMEAFARYVEAKGMKFGAWLEPEFAMKHSDWGRRHADWFHDAGATKNIMQPFPDDTFPDMLLRLEDPAVRASVLDFLVSWVQRYHIQWIRWDLNNIPLPYWQALEPARRTGWLQLGYGEGLLTLLDEFMARCPQVHLEACAGGGHRLDLGTLRRAHSSWMNDNSHSYDAIRRFQAGMNRILPGNYGGSCFLWITHPEQRLQRLDDFAAHGYPPAVLRSRMAGALGFAEQSRFWTEEIKENLRQEVERYKAIRHLLLKDFYPLFTPISLYEYDGWQFHDPESGDGVLMVFRVLAASSNTEVRLSGLAPATEYLLTDVDSGQVRTIRADESISLNLPELQGTCWLTYRPADR